MFSYLIDDYNLNASLSKDTKKAYLLDLYNFFEFILNRNNLKNKIKSEVEEINLFNSLTKIDMYAYVDYLHDEKNNSSKTIARKISAIKSLFKYLYKNNFITSNQIISFKYKYNNKSNSTQILSDEKIQKLINYVNKYQSDRNKLVIYFILFNGLTIKDLQNIKTKDIFEDTIIIYRDSKKEKIIKINDSLRAILRRFSVSSEHLYLLNPSNDNPISKRTLQNIVKNVLLKIEIKDKGISSGILRNTAVYMIQKYSNINYNKLKNFTGLTTDNQIKKYIYNKEESKIVSAEELNKNPFIKLK